MLAVSDRAGYSPSLKGRQPANRATDAVLSQYVMPHDKDQSLFQSFATALRSDKFALNCSALVSLGGRLLHRPRTPRAVEHRKYLRSRLDYGGGRRNVCGVGRYWLGTRSKFSRSHDLLYISIATVCMDLASAAECEQLPVGDGDVADTYNGQE